MLRTVLLAVLVAALALGGATGAADSLEGVGSLGSETGVDPIGTETDDGVASEKTDRVDAADASGPRTADAESDPAATGRPRSDVPALDRLVGVPDAPQTSDSGDSREDPLEPEEATPNAGDRTGATESDEESVADADGDGLPDEVERELGTDPTDPDTDDDGLEDGRERELGTNATRADTDGDGLLDGNEVANESRHGAPIPGADPLRKDLYLQVTVSENSEPLTEGELAGVENAWAEMPVANPDDSQGVALHVDQVEVDETVDIRSNAEFRALRDRYAADGERASVLGDRRSVYHHVALVEMETGYAGWGETGGRFAIVDEKWTGREGEMTHRSTTVVHELLHTVLGELDDANQCHAEFDGRSARHHACDGWLSYDDGPDAHYLPEGLAAQLQRADFL